MSQITVVTSCSRSGWETYGRRFVETFLEYWPEDVALHLVTEDLPGDAITSVKWKRDFSVWALWKASPAARAFHERHDTNALARGTERRPEHVGWTPKKAQAGYNFRYDAYRFAKKVFAIELIARHTAAGRLFWVDADVATFAPAPREVLEKLLPVDKALSCLDRGELYHSECGFVGYGLDHAATRPFIEAFAKLYAADEVFALQEWHDSWVFDWLRRRMKVPTYAIPHCSRSQPFANSELSRFADHAKGANKAIGRTPKEKRVIRDAIGYWQ